ncbi:hypothetical protein GCM10027031_14900 [Corynebacterium atrinae]
MSSEDDSGPAAAIGAGGDGVAAADDFDVDKLAERLFHRIGDYLLLMRRAGNIDQRRGQGNGVSRKIESVHPI